MMIACYQLSVAHPRHQGMLFDEITLELPRGAWVELTGPSGCGKSVLFSLLALRALPMRGKLVVGGRNLDRVGSGGLAELRRRIGACAQIPALLPQRTTLENLLLPCLARGEHDQAAKQAAALLEQVGLGGVEDVLAGALTPREQSTVCALRAMMGQPELILIDAALEALDEPAQRGAIAALRQAHGRGATVVLFGREAILPRGIKTLELRLEEGVLEPITRHSPTPSPEHGARRR